MKQNKEPLIKMLDNFTCKIVFILCKFLYVYGSFYIFANCLYGIIIQNKIIKLKKNENNKFIKNNFNKEKMSDIKEITIVVKWSAKEYPITDLTNQDTVAVLRHEIFKKTQVRPERQKLLNLKYKGK